MFLLRQKIKKIFIILIVILIIILVSNNTFVFANTENNYIQDSTTIGTVSKNDISGYTIGGFTVSSSPPNFSLRYETYANSLGTSDTVTYNETSCQYGWQDSSDSNYTSCWSCRVNATEHKNTYGWYTTNIYFVNQDGSTELHTSNQVYISPIAITYTAPLVETTTIPVKYNYSDVAGGTIATSQWASGIHNCQYFEQGGSSTSFTGNAFTLPTPGTYTLFVKDSLGYEKVQIITVSAANSTLMLGVTQANPTTTTSTPIVNVLATKINNHNDEITVAGTDGDWYDMTTAKYTDSAAPYQSWSNYSYTFSKAIAHTFVYRDGGQDYSNSGDKYVAAYFYKNLSGTFSAQHPGLEDSLWQGGYVYVIKTFSLKLSHGIIAHYWDSKMWFTLRREHGRLLWPSRNALLSPFRGNPCSQRLDVNHIGFSSTIMIKPGTVLDNFREKLMIKHSYANTTLQCQNYNADSQWHFNYSELQVANPVTNAFEDSAVRLNGSTANNSVAINGVFYTKVPSGSDESLGVTRKWAYGTQPASYFDAGMGLL